MKIFQGTQNIVGKSLYMNEVKVDRRLEKFFEIRLAEISYYINMVESVPVLRRNNFNNRNQVFMFQKS
jgi:hypothetical protein